MKCAIVFYSEAGHTKAIAKGIRDGIKKEGGQCDLIYIKDMKPKAWLDYDLVGIGAPVWSSTPTTNIIVHINKLPAEVRGKHAFFFCTHGIAPGRCVIRGVQPMLDKGLCVIGWKDWYCGSNVQNHGKPWFSDGHPDEFDMADAGSFGAAMVRHSKLISGGLTSIIPKLPSPAASDEIYGVGHPYLFQRPDNAGAMPENIQVKEAYPLEIPETMGYVMRLEGMGDRNMNEAMRQFELKINADKCTGCGRCARGCYCDNIDASVFPPRFITQRCEGELFCAALCPVGAIEIVRTGEISGPPPMKGPGAMELALYAAEATGRFRRLVPEEIVNSRGGWQMKSADGKPTIKEAPWENLESSDWVQPHWDNK